MKLSALTFYNVIPQELTMKLQDSDYRMVKNSKMLELAPTQMHF